VTNRTFFPAREAVPGRDVRAGGLAGAAGALYIVEQARSRQSPCLAITASTTAAYRLEEELRFLAGNDFPVLHFPDWEILPYDNFSPHQDLVSQRLETLSRIPQLQRAVLVVPVTTLLHRVCPPSFVAAGLVLRAGSRLAITQLRRSLEESGYQCVDTVYEHGQFAVRGSIVDLFPMGHDIPVRIELFDDEVDTLRHFDPETQRSGEKLEEINLLPAREFPFTKEALDLFRERFRERFDVDYRQCPVYQDISRGIAAPGIEYYQPLFFSRMAALIDYLPAGATLFTLPGLHEAAETFWQEVRERYEQRRGDRIAPLLPPTDLFLPVDELFSSLKALPRHVLSADMTASDIDTVLAGTPPPLPVNARAEDPVAALRAHLAEPGRRVLLCAESAGRREALLESLGRQGLHPEAVDGWLAFVNGASPFAITLAALELGMELPQAGLSVIAEPQLFGERVMQRRRRERQQAQAAENTIRNLSELRIGAPVVHIDVGVGRYLGLTTLTVDGQALEFLTLEYAEGAKLYVPVANLHLVARYSGGDEDNAPLHRLGSDQWAKAKRKAAEQVRDVAAELLDVHARRAARKGVSFGVPELDYAAFSAGFPFEETPDQQVAIENVIADLKAAKPMDRLVCGDVGFGKTEVAMRAAFVVAQSGRQVAVLVPTTLLAQQHYESFRDRFADWPVTIEVLSRFKTGQETDAALARLAEGKIDIVIGTHKLLQPDVKFSNLGLLIVDEEHRFGVRQKEQLKQLRAEVDMLTLTATPIPRTLNMAFAGLRDISIIATPPARRLSIKTFVREDNPALVKEAILRELLRGGQVYYLHNEVKTIEKCAADITALVPEARVAVAHGQMRERELEEVMGAFYHRRHNVLVCSTIIETGIDVPTANTIVIERADKFGLAQLHQLRGRVGRSHHQAYAWLLTPNRRAMSDDAVKRLDAIASAQELGAGFALASQDLEIRGAGELLGEDQSGNIQTIGLSLYMEMLDRAVKAIRAGKQPNLDQPFHHGAEVNLNVPALIPDDYLGDVHTRLVLYKRIANAGSEEDLKELQVEMIDRFGLLPAQVRLLFRVTTLKLLADKLGIRKIDGNAAGARLEFEQDTPVDPLTLIQLVQRQPQKHRMEGGNRLRLVQATQSHDERIDAVEQLLAVLAAPPASTVAAKPVTSSKRK
jgi:transcription-repair coupling factor (superfamily II helicase)